MTTMPLVAANWRMNTTREEAMALAKAIASGLPAGIEVAVFPPFPWLTEVAAALEGTGAVLGAQNMHHEARGGYTGEVSPLMLKGLCRYVIVGHSERRVHFKETDWQINRKLLAALEHGLSPVLCVGESAEQLEHGETGIVIASQLEAALKDVPIDGRLVIAYEPAWATMGMATPPAPEDIGEVCRYIRVLLAEDSRVPTDLRVIYGGPVTTRNAAGLARQDGIEGLLVGSASLRAEDFLSIVAAFAASK